MADVLAAAGRVAVMPGRRLVGGIAAWPSASGVRGWLEAERPQWFNWLPVALGCGIAVYFALPAEPSLLAVAAPLSVALLFSLLVRRGSISAALVGVFVAACLGLVLAKLRSDNIAAPVLERRMGPVEVRGFVELVEPRETRGERLTIRVTSIDGVSRDRTPRRVRIRTMNNPDGGAVLKPGDAVRVKAHLAPPSGPVLPGGYDFARGAYFQGLGGIGYALSRAAVDVGAGPPPDGLAWPAAIARLRHDISARVTAALPGQTGAIATALISGERGGISTATNDAYRDSGLFHVLSISGLHMAIMGGAVFYAVRIALAMFPSIALRYPVKKWAAAAAILASLGYLAISGAAFATVRSAVTITIMFIAVLLDRPAIAMRNVALSALLILLIWPESLNDVGFQMSFAAVVALVASYEALRRRLLRRAAWPEGAMAKAGLFIGGIVLSTFIASVAVAPFGAYYFHKGQQLAIVANVIATPVINLVIMPAALGALALMPLGLERFPLALMGFGIDATTRTAEWVASLPGAATRISAISVASFVTMAAGGLWLLLWRERPRWLGLAVIAMGLAMAPLTPRPDILVGHDGQLVAARTSGGLLTALAAPQTGFELSRWLEHDGDARTPKEAVAAPGFSCDGLGCVARVRGLTLAYPRHPAAIADDCARADIVLLTVPRPKGCTRPKAVIDFFALRAQGTHAIYIASGDTRKPGIGGPGGGQPGAGFASPATTHPISGLDMRRGQPPAAAGIDPGASPSAMLNRTDGVSAGPNGEPNPTPRAATAASPAVSNATGFGPDAAPVVRSETGSAENAARNEAAPDEQNSADGAVLALSSSQTEAEHQRAATSRDMGESSDVSESRATPGNPVAPPDRPVAGDMPKLQREAASNRVAEAKRSQSSNDIAATSNSLDQQRALVQAFLHIVTVASARGDRPWSRLPWWAMPRNGDRDAAAASGERSRSGSASRSGDGTSLDPSGAEQTGAEQAWARRQTPPTASMRSYSRLWAFAASPEFLASQQIPRAEAEIEDALRDPSLYDERW